MKTQWILDTHGDPLGTLRQFVNAVWEGAALEAMLVPLNGRQNVIAEAQLIRDSGQLDNVNPFKPLMTLNTANLIPDTIKENSGLHIGAMMRPCELRAMIEMVKHDGFSTNDVLTICADCLGTFPVEDFRWRADRKGTPGKLTQETLQFARQGGISAYRYRPACQVCPAPDARGAHINIGVLGLPVRQNILVSARDEETAERLRLDEITDDQASQALIAQHDRTLAKIVERNRQYYERLASGLSEVLPKDLDELIDQMHSCEICQNCLDVCPICVVGYPQRAEDGKYIREDVARWIISCSGCGMCEDACPKHLPLNAIFLHIRAQLAGSYDYSPGHSSQEQLPTM
jgi:formate dehydrogenase subunit beta